MRHTDISTTMGYYVDLDADELAEDLYRAHDAEKIGQKGTVLGAVAPEGDLSKQDSAVEEDAVSTSRKMS